MRRWGRREPSGSAASAAQARAQTTARRLETLLKGGAISGDELEAAQTALKTAEEAVRAADFAVARAEHELQLARARLKPSSGGGGTVTLVAPVDGVVLKRLRESASVVPVGEPLLEIGDPATPRDRGGFPLDRRRPHLPRPLRGDRPVGRQPSAGRTRPAGRAVRLHEGVGARRRRAARQRHRRFRG